MMYNGEQPYYYTKHQKHRKIHRPASHTRDKFVNQNCFFLSSDNIIEI